jgi:hypothetical protein
MHRRCAGGPREVRGRCAGGAREVRGRSAGGPREVRGRSAGGPRELPFGAVVVHRASIVHFVFSTRIDRLSLNCPRHQERRAARHIALSIR